jgi:hypothetical protein
MLDELRAKARPAPPEGEQVATLVIDDPDAAQAALDGALAYLGAGRSRRTLRLVIEGTEVGYLDRSDLYGNVELRSKSPGDAAHAGLPGRPRYRSIQLRCPVAGCPANPILTATYDEEAPRTCPAHPGTVLELEP